MPVRTMSERAILTRPTADVSVNTWLLDVNMRLTDTIAWQRAVTMLVAGSVQTLAPYMYRRPDGSSSPVMVRSPSRTLEMPFIVSTVRFVSDPYASFLRARSERASTRAILQRDQYRCAYCEERATTKDHVLPESRGGPTTWTNLVAACVDCNQRKANRTPQEAGMPLLWEPWHYDGFSEDLEQEIWEFLLAAAGTNGNPRPQVAVEV